jgi:glucose-1-phosphate thymidylyltransferase
VKVYVLVAGYATRLGAVAAHVPKSLMEVAGAPILSHILDRIVQLDDVSQIVVISNERFAEQFREWARTYETPVPLQLLNDGSTCDEDKLGAVGDIAFATREIPPDGEDWLVVAGDNLVGFDLRPLLRIFLERRRPILPVRAMEHGRGPTRYNEITVGEDSRVLRFREKPADPQTGLMAIALYFFTPEVIDLLRQYLAGDGDTDAPGHFMSWLVRQIPVDAVDCGGEWFDIGNLASLQDARTRFEPPTSSGLVH